MKIKSSLLLISALTAMSFSSCSTFSLVNSEVYNDADLSDFHTFRIITPGEGKLPPGMEMVTYYNIAAAVREQMVERGYVEDPASPIVINFGLTVKREVQTEPLSAVTPPPPPAPIVAPPPPPGPVGPPLGPGGPSPGDGPEPSYGIQPPPPGPAGPPSGPPLGQMNWFPYGGPGPAPGYAPFFMYPRSYYWNPNAMVVTGIYKEGVLTMDIVNIQTKMALFSASVATILENGDAQFRNLSGINEAVQTLFKKYPVPLLPQYRNQKK